MKLLNRDLEDMLERSQAWELMSRVENSCTEDMEDLSELDWLIEEASFVLEDFVCDTGSCLHDDYLWSKHLLKKTENGKCIPISIETFEPLKGYAPDDIEGARSVLKEVDSTRKFIHKLRNLKYGDR